MIGSLDSWTPSSCVHMCNTCIQSSLSSFYIREGMLNESLALDEELVIIYAF